MPATSNLVGRRLSSGLLSEQDSQGRADVALVGRAATANAQAQPAESHSGHGADDGLCCFPYLTGNAVFPACSAAGLGFYHFVDLQHIMAQEVPGKSGAQTRTAVLDAHSLGLTGTLSGEQVRL